MCPHYSSYFRPSSVGTPAAIVAIVGRCSSPPQFPQASLVLTGPLWQCIESMKSYLTTDAVSIFNYINVTPARCVDPDTYDDLTWITNGRQMFRRRFVSITLHSLPHIRIRNLQKHWFTARDISISRRCANSLAQRAVPPVIQTRSPMIDPATYCEPES